MLMEKLNAMNGRPCLCGKVHSFDAEVYVGNAIIKKIPDYIRKYAPKKVFLLSDQNTWNAAGKQVSDVLHSSGIQCTSYRFTHFPVEPDEYSVGAAVMHFDSTCDLIIGIGSGVINDIGKILSKLSGKPYMIVATAPSMDGYASASSSMTRSGLKISLPSRSADIIVGDTQILCQAPLHMMKSGLGDMIAKYVSICEWRIAELVTEEYFCPQIAQLVRQSLKRCIDNAQGLLKRDETAVQAVFEGLVICGVAMNYAGLSRPASGVEHYISHVLDMRGVEFGTPVELHGIQCAVGTLIAARLYEKLKATTPDKEKALSYASNFSYDHWAQTLRAFLGKGAESMIALEEKERKYDLDAHRQRLEIILKNWDKILDIINQELPASQELETLLDTLEAPKSLESIGLDAHILPTVIKATKDIRDKYVLSRLAWDLGILDELV